MPKCDTCGKNNENILFKIETSKTVCILCEGKGDATLWAYMTQDSSKFKPYVITTLLPKSFHKPIKPQKLNYMKYLAIDSDIHVLEGHINELKKLKIAHERGLLMKASRGKTMKDLLQEYKFVIADEEFRPFNRDSNPNVYGAHYDNGEGDYYNLEDMSWFLFDYYRDRDHMELYVHGGFAEDFMKLFDVKENYRELAEEDIDGYETYLLHDTKYDTWEIYVCVELNWVDDERRGQTVQTYISHADITNKLKEMGIVV